MQALRACGAGDSRGIVINLEAVQPEISQENAFEAARLFDLRANKWFLYPLLKGSYPDFCFWR
jgi:beta-glucosidase/6-phospho-beta-glucosidase/beta-galactosidase